MPRYRTSEYSHLILAERAIAEALRAKEVDGVLVYPEPKDVASLASALTRVVDQKRIMRGQPAPKPADVAGRRKRTAEPTIVPLGTSAVGGSTGA